MKKEKKNRKRKHSENDVQHVTIDSDVIFLFEKWQKSNLISDLQLLHSKTVDGGVEKLNSDHVMALLEAFTATLSEKDQYISSILRSIEQNSSIKFAKLSPIVFGDLAKRQYADLKTLGPALCNRLTIDEILDSLDGQMLWKTVIFMPLDLKMGQICQDDPKIADVRFLLPFLATLVAEENELDCRKFVEQNCLALAFASLSLSDKYLRQFGYLILHRFAVHLKHLATTVEKFPEKSQFVYLINLLKNSVENGNQKIACLVSHFLARVSKLLLHPEDPVYSPISTFLMLKPTLDLENVPEFFKLFNSGSSEHFQRERHWILQLVAEGLRQNIDYHLLEKRGGFKLFLSHFSSGLSDARSRSLILRSIKSVCQLDSGCQNLVRKQNLICWIGANCTFADVTPWELGFLADILTLCWGKLAPDLDPALKASFMLCAAQISNLKLPNANEIMPKLNEIVASG